MKINLKITLFLLVGSAITLIGCSKDGETGPQGEQGIQGIEGEQGTKGDPGNANVEQYNFVVATADWSPNLHFGAQNIYRYYQVSTDSIGGRAISQLYDEGYAILAYAQPNYASESDRETVKNLTKLLPYTTMVSTLTDKFGLLIDLNISSNRLLLAKTINGYEPDQIPEEDIPTTINFRIVLIESSNAIPSTTAKSDLLADLKSAGIDVGDYTAVMKHYGIAY
ncbi:hypothetical protein SAMN05421766_104483 [Zobellia uliginosa]|uniref:Collagen triple helix repeat-containing protein n=1 Tax=Zobellia uliginosa TaxID=143224 RepID=A0ABY1L0I8_9FLAO|nr:collagen-like protein [Zobellia uliginosa]SIS86592.1 hypothetical protein SAMN05421766_104483 [Zobellia uliginosa]